jgi:UDP-3-O-[3-hydroxymyristoyl] N-acetylglucosamine deacetylase/3-hydroxyacyl-[acyl-carrier-protein] dehydratase
MEKQKTIAKDIKLNGIGLHTGKMVNVSFKPAQTDAGITFVRTDISSRPEIKATIDSWAIQSIARRRSSIGSDGAQIHTVEHLMAALSGLDIDNLIVEIDNEELPGLDGSSLNFVETLIKAGLIEQDKERRYYCLKEPIFVEDTDSTIAVLPYPELKISYSLDYQHPYLKSGFLEIKINPQIFQKELASARTFCLEDEAEDLKKQGLGKGANYDNTLVVGKDGVINNKLRFPDEFIRHKILDLLGDLYLLGEPLKCHVIAVKSGHSLNLKMLKKINEQRNKGAASRNNDKGATVADSGGMDINEIMKILPHRHPFLFVDRIVSLQKGKHVVGIKNVTMNDYFFKGHFPGRPVMPGVIILEAMAQVGGVMMLSAEENKGKFAYFMSINNAKFRKTVLPGDQLVLDVTAVKIRSKTGIVRGEAIVDGKVVAEADLMFALGD